MYRVIAPQVNENLINAFVLHRFADDHIKTTIDQARAN